MNREHIKLKYTYNGRKIEVILFNSSVWINQSELMKLFQMTKYTISRHLKKALIDSKSNSLVAKFATSGKDNKTYMTNYYCQELVKIAGIKTSSSITMDFINWADKIIKEEQLENALPIEVFEDGDFKLEVSISPNEETVWLTQEQTAKLYLTSKQLISFHANNILKENELEEATVKKNLTVQIENGREVNREILNYNLDMILSIGYRINSKKGIAFRRWANKVLKQYLYKGYALDETRVSLYRDNYLELTNSVLKLESKVQTHDDQIKELKGIINKSYNKIFFKGQFYDAYSLLIDIIKTANKNILLIDNYIDHETLNILSSKNENVDITIITRHNTLPSLAITNFKKQYTYLNIINSNDFHDRFLIIDNFKLYHIGASLKDIGKKCFAITELKRDILELMDQKLTRMK